MAFAFFRRRQKMVVIIMALLMVSFLIGFQGFQTLTRDDPRERVFATTSLGEMEYGELTQANIELRVLRESLGLGNPDRMVRQNWPTDTEFLTADSGESSNLTYALLLKEARRSDELVIERDIDRFFQHIGCPVGSENYRGLIARLRTGPKRAERQLRAVVGNWLRINKAYLSCAVNVPPSEKELRQIYRNLNETIDLLVVRVSTERYIDDVPKPTREEIFEQFDRSRTVSPGSYPAVGSFGFGYHQPPRVRISYMFVPREVVERVTPYSESDARLYFRRHREEFVRKIPLTTQPATARGVSPGDTAAPTTEPTTEPTEFRTEPLTFSEAKQQIVDKLKPPAVQRRMEGVLSRAEALLQEYQKTDVIEQNAYDWVKERMTRSADAVLDRRLDVLEIRQERLDVAMGSLAQKAGLVGICYPYGKTGEGELDPGVKVTLSGRNVELSDALKRISKQVKWPEVRWAMCEGFEGVIFPTGEGTDLFPIVVRHTELIDRPELLKDEILAASAAPAGQPLSLIAFQTQTLTKDNRPSVVKINEEAPRMMVQDPKPGMLLWRLTEAVPAHPPETMTPEIEQQVIRDIKTYKAFGRARTAARQLAERASKEGLEKAAKMAQLETFNIGPIARQFQFSLRRQLIFLMMQNRIAPGDAIRRIMLDPPFRFSWSNVPEIPVPTMQLRKHFLTKAFALAPKNIEPAPGDTPYPEKPYALAIADLPALREVLILQRTGFRPAVTGEYEQTGRQAIINAMKDYYRWETRMGWFSLPAVKRRLRYQQRER